MENKKPEQILQDFNRKYPMVNKKEYDHILNKWRDAAWEIEKVYTLLHLKEISMSKARELTRSIIEHHSKINNNGK